MNMDWTWSWVSFVLGAISFAFVRGVVVSIYRTWKEAREARRLAEKNDAAIRCHHGIKKWMSCKSCAEEFAYHTECLSCRRIYDNRHPHQCGGNSGFSGFLTGPVYGHSRVSGWSGCSGISGYIPPGVSRFSGISGFSGYKDVIHYDKLAAAIKAKAASEILREKYGL